VQADDPCSVKLFLHMKRIARMLKLEVSGTNGSVSVTESSDKP